jgi:hypothetical protein
MHISHVSPRSDVRPLVGRVRHDVLFQILCHGKAYEGHDLCDVALGVQAEILVSGI